MFFSGRSPPTPSLKKLDRVGQQPPTAALVKLRVPKNGSSCVYGMFGGMYYPHNGVIEVPPEDVIPLLRRGYMRLDAQ